LRILTSYIRKQRPDRKLSIACFDFIHDYTDRRWKFLNLKYFYTEDASGELDRDLFLLKNSLNTAKRSGSPIKEVSPQHIRTEEEPNYMKKTKCEGDYCTINFFDTDFDKKFQQS